MLPMELFTLQGLWFVLAGVFLIGYAVTDGFDLGTGFSMIFTKNEEDRNVLYNVIAPVWDGN
jgi:cytochrome d ubiquinol oxidase subunit II